MWGFLITLVSKITTNYNKFEAIIAEEFFECRLKFAENDSCKIYFPAEDI